MALKFQPLLVLFSLFCLIFVSESEAPFKPNALALPVIKDSATGLHVTNISTRTPLLPVPFLIDLNGRFLWQDCEQHYSSSMYRAPYCQSTQCTQVGSHRCHKCQSKARPGCHNNSCEVITTNAITHARSTGEVGQDVFAIPSNKGSYSGPIAKVRDFLFACSPSYLLRGLLPHGVKGIAGFGHSSVSLPTQLASTFGFPQMFALCLSIHYQGVIFFGDGPYRVLPAGQDFDPVDQYTPLTISKQGEYFIQVSSITINSETVPALNSTFATMITTTIPYTTLQTSIYKVFIQMYARKYEARQSIRLVEPVAPFDLCYDAKNVTVFRDGPAVPDVEFRLHNTSTTWYVSGFNLMVKPNPDVWCLAFVDGGPRPRAPIVLGTHHFEENLLKFDLANSRLGFSGYLTVSVPYAYCGFNFTSTPV